MKEENDMGFFSRIKDVADGKTYKLNILVNDNLKYLMKDYEKMPDSDFFKHWLLASATSLSCFMELILFIDDEHKEFQVISKFQKLHTDRLTPDRSFEIMKIVEVCYFLAFIRNDHNLALLNTLDVDVASLKNDIFKLFRFNQSDIEDFNFLSFVAAQQDASAYMIKRGKLLLSKAYRIDDTLLDPGNLAYSVYINGMISESYTSGFLPLLEKIVDQYWKALT
jgi:hypothetical protein